MNLIHTSPVSADTDGDGIGDAADDEDGDGLGNLDEISQQGTDPLIADSDADGLSDGQELGIARSFY